MSAVMVSGDIDPDVILDVLDTFEAGSVALCLPQDDTGLSPRRRPIPEPLFNVMPYSPRATRAARTVWNALSVEDAIWASVGRIYWIQDHAGAFPQPGTGGFACGMTASIAARHGISVACIDRFGLPETEATSIALLVANAQKALLDYDRQCQEDRDWIRTDGIVLDASISEAVLWSADGGALSAGFAGLSCNLTWRILRLENFIARSDLLKSAVGSDEAIVNSELDKIAEGFRREVDSRLKISIMYW